MKDELFPSTFLISVPSSSCEPVSGPKNKNRRDGPCSPNFDLSNKFLIIGFNFRDSWRVLKNMRGIVVF